MVKRGILSERKAILAFRMTPLGFGFQGANAVSTRLHNKIHQNMHRLLSALQAMGVLKVEEVRRKLQQVWALIRNWRWIKIINWTFSRLLNLVKTKLPTVRLFPRTCLFPITKDANVPDPSSLWSPMLKARGSLPTNSAWLNFAMNEGSMPEYIHPYIIRCKQGALSISFPSQEVSQHAITQAFVPDMTVGSTSNHDPSSLRQHRITSFDDVSVTLELHGGISVPLVRGCPYITFIFNTVVMPSFATTHKTMKLIPNEKCTKHMVFLQNKQCWIIYSSHELCLVLDSGLIKVQREYRGVVRIVMLPGGAEAEAVLDEHATTYPVGGKASLSVPFQISYTWKKMGPADKSLLMLSLPIHRDMMARDDNMGPNKAGTFLHSSLTYDGIDGKMEAIASDSWVLKTSNISSIGWYSINGIQKSKNKRELITVLRHDMSELVPLPENIISAYSHGKFMARVAHIAMIAEEVGSCLDVLKQAKELLMGSLTAWLEGSFKGNALVYESKWGGIVEQKKSVGAIEGVYDDAHYTLGYFCYAGAVLAKLDEPWGKAHRAHLYTLLGDYMSGATGHTLKPNDDYEFPRLRHFDLWVLHSWGGDGLMQNEHGRRQLSSSEAVHAYYAGAMLGLAYTDGELVNLSLTLASLEIKAAQYFWHIPSSSTVYPSPFVANNRMIRVLRANMRESLPTLCTQSSTNTDSIIAQTPGLAPSSSYSCMGMETTDEALLHLVGMQVSPLVPISEVLFSNTAFAKELVDWVSPSLNTHLTADIWKAHIYALEALYEQGSDFIKKAFALSYPNAENCRSILLWWIYTRKIESNGASI